MGTYCGTAEMTICSWKLDEKGVLRKAINCEHTIQPVHDIHSHSYLFFGRAGDLGAAVFDLFWGFIVLYFAGNDYTGSGYFRDLFPDFKRMTSAEEVELLPISWTECWSEYTTMREFQRQLHIENDFRRWGM